VKLFAPQALLTRLRQHGGASFQLLTAPLHNRTARQQTLWDAIEWSYNLLTSDERLVLARLGVFVGGCTLAATAAVLSFEFRVPSGRLSSGTDNSKLKTQNSKLEILDGLASLVDKSLLRQIPGADGEPRFVMLETIRAYALERLTRSGERAAI